MKLSRTDKYYFYRRAIKREASLMQILYPESEYPEKWQVKNPNYIPKHSNTELSRIYRNLISNINELEKGA